MPAVSSPEHGAPRKFVYRALKHQPRSGIPMAIKIIVSDTVAFKVKGSINDVSGTAQPFDFKLTCLRLDTDAIEAKLNGGITVVDFMCDVVEDWSGVRDADDKPLPYSETALRQLFKIAGVAGVAYKTYLQEVGAKEKN
jgi:hypothetical protein